MPRLKSNSCASPTDPGVQRCGHLSVCERIPRRHSAPLHLLFHILRTKIAHLSPTTGGTPAFTKFPFSMPFPLTINGRAQTNSRHRPPNSSMPCIAPNPPKSKERAGHSGLRMVSNRYNHHPVDWRLTCTPNGKRNPKPPGCCPGPGFPPCFACGRVVPRPNLFPEFAPFWSIKSTP